MINHRIARLVFAFGVGILVAVFAFHSVTDPEPARQRALEEAAVFAARDFLRETIDAGDGLEVVDPLAPDRVVGKSYIYPDGDGWQVSGHYRRGETDPWHPFLLTLTPELTLSGLAVRDSNPALAAKAADDPRLQVTE